MGDTAQEYRSRMNLRVKVLDFVQLGGPDLTKSRTEADSDIAPSLGMGAFNLQRSNESFRLGR